MSKGYGGGGRAVEVCTDTAVWDHTGLPAGAVRWGLIRDPRGELAAQALVTTHLEPEPGQIREWVVRRWTREVPFAEARAHLGLEPQRQGKDLAIGRTMPTLFGLSSLVTLLAHVLRRAEVRVVRLAAWYVTVRPPFSEALAVLRRELWSTCSFSMSRVKAEGVEIPRSLWERFTDAVCYAA